MNTRWVIISLIVGSSVGFFARSWVDADEDREDDVIELFSGDRLEVKLARRGTGVLIVHDDGEGRPNQFEIRSGEELVFEVSHDPPSEERVRIIRALDGDTLVVDRYGKEERVRLLGVDTPEIFGEFYSVEAWEKTKEVSVGKQARLVYDSNRRTGDLGRILAYVYVGNTHLNALLVREGYGRLPDRADQVDMDKFEEFERLEKNAEEKNLGVWNDRARERWETAFIEERHYIASRATFHRPSCPHAQDLLDPKRFSSLETALRARRAPCSKCLPTRNYDPKNSDDD